MDSSFSRNRYSFFSPSILSNRYDSSSSRNGSSLWLSSDSNDNSQNEISSNDDDNNNNNNDNDGNTNNKEYDDDDSSSWEGKMNPLLGLVMDRAMTTLSSRNNNSFDSFAGRNMDNYNNNNNNNNNNPTTTVVADATAGYQRPLSNDSNTKEQQQKNNNNNNNNGFSYLGNPNVTPTAMAQFLWKDVVIPNNDTIIDATCGNGKDASALAQMLFPPKDDTDNNDDDTTNSSSDGPLPELICIDIQERACRNTEQSLLQTLQQMNHMDAYHKYVRVLHTSHAPLPMPRSKQSVGLICYNLGYLPGNDDDDSSSSSLTPDDDIILTQTKTTLESLSQAASLLRVGGLLSVLTYPGSNAQEASAVHSFCTGLAMFSTRQEGGWEQHLQSTVGIEDTTYSPIYEALNHVQKQQQQQQTQKQTWRVFDHRPLGRPNSPILITALRIK